MESTRKETAVAVENLDLYTALDELAQTLTQALGDVEDLDTNEIPEGQQIALMVIHEHIAYALALANHIPNAGPPE